MKTKEIRQQVTINALPAAVYEALMDSRKHTEFTGGVAKMSSKRGGAFTCYDGYIEGVNLELAPGRLIVQAWRSEDWPMGTWSIVTFKLTKLGGGKTKLSFTQAGVPAGDCAKKNKGWGTHYWQRLNRYFERE